MTNEESVERGVVRELDVTPGRAKKPRKEELRLEGDPDTNRMLGTVALERGELAAAGREAKRTENGGAITFGTEGEGLHLFPMPETQGFIDADAVAFLAQAESLKQQRVLENQDLFEKTYLCFLRCEHGHHGIYFSKKPEIGQPVPDAGWFASYKRADHVYRMRPVCQVCDTIWKGRRTPLPARVHEDGTFTVDHEHVWRIARDRRRALIEGETKAFESRFPSNNMWREEMKQRLKEHNLVWID